VCDTRFYAWGVAARFVFYVHCARCGNMNLERVSRERVATGLRLLGASLFRMRGYRCDQCRGRFFSLRPYKKITPTRTAPAGVASQTGLEAASAGAKSRS